MEDLTKYIESLLDGIKNPCEVKYRDNVYYVDIVQDFRNNYTMYQISDPYIKDLVDRVESMLKTYLPEFKFKFNVKVKRINVPIKTQEMWII
jgi:hypothetical protein